MDEIKAFVRKHVLELLWTAMIGIASIAVTAAAVYASRAADTFVSTRSANDFRSRLRVVGPLSLQSNSNTWVATCDSGEIALGGFCQLNSRTDGRTTKYVLHNAGTPPPFTSYACSYQIDGGLVQPPDISVWAHCYGKSAP